MKTLLTLVFLGVASLASAQVNGTVGDSFAWDQVNQSVATAQGAGYNYYLDNVAVKIPAAGVTCVVHATIPANATCKSVIPASIALGVHSITLTQTIAGVESADSAPLSFRLNAKQSTTAAQPQALRITP